MAEIVNINPINPTTFEFQEYSVSDSSLITSFDVDNTFDPAKDYLEYFIYDLNGNILIENVSGFPGYKLIDNNIVLDPEADLRAYGYTEGQYNTVYNFLSRELASNSFNTYYISQISSDRTEVRLDTTSIPNDLVISSSLELISNIQNATGSYYDFNLDFGNNNLIIGVNALLDTSSINNPTVLIKLYEPLPEQFDINSQCWVVNQIASPVAYNISITQTFDLLDNKIQLKGPNTNISINNQINNSTDYTSYQTLSATTSSLAQGTSSLHYQLNNILAQTGITINVDYSDYANFIHFSSALTRLENFYYKLQLLEEYTYSASLSSGSSSSSYYVSSSNVVWQSKINEIITNFDSYEYYLYYSSGSTAWPKTNSTPPYTNVSTTSVTGLTWFANQSEVAELYDSENNNLLTLAIPSYLRDDSNNDQYILFVEMIGQLFDNVFVYLQGITDKANNDNRLNYGVSKDLIADVLRDLGIKIYQNNFSSNDLYQALIGMTPSGNLYNLPFTTTQYPVPTGSGLEYITSYITASSTSSLISTYDINASTYKRIYNSVPYILKKKGSYAGLRALINLFGIPDTVLRISEFGGQNKINTNDYDYWYDQFNYAFYTSGSNYVTSSFSLNSSWGASNNVPQAVEFRFKTDGLPQNTASITSQSLWETDGLVKLILKYTGSGYNSGSYSGSTVDPYYQYAKLDLIPDYTSPNTSASIYLPFYDGGWWSILVNKEGTNYTLYAKNKIYNGDDGNFIGFQASSSVDPSTSTPWNNSTKSYFGVSSSLSGKVFTGSLQEIRYYTTALSQSIFDDYVMNPYAIDGNSINIAPNVLAFRAPLGSDLITSSRTSIHPKVTGSWVTTSSFASNSNYYYSTASFEQNTEVIFVNEFPAGIKNRISNKIQQQNIVLPYSSNTDNNIPTNQVLSPFRSIQQQSVESGSYIKNINYVEIAFSPQNEINDDINEQLGYFNIGEYIGDPRFQSSSLEYYPNLNTLSYSYFEKYTTNYQWFDYIRLIEFFDNSLFKMLQDFVPARTDLASGIVLKQHVLERNRYRPPQASTSASLANVGSGSTFVPYIVEDQTITGSIDVGTVEGGNGGSMPDLLGLTSSLYTYPGVVNVDQVWYGSTPSLSGSVPFTESAQLEFYDGQLSGSNLVVTTGKLSDYEVITPIVYTTGSFKAAYTYPTFFYAIPLDDGWARVTASAANYIDYNFNSDKTYYLSFTATVTNVMPSEGINMVIVNSDSLFAKGVTSGSISQQIAQGAINLQTGVNTIQNYEVTGLLPYIYFLNINGVSNTPIPYNDITITDFTVREAVLTDPNGYVVENDVEISRPSSKYMDVDFATNAITAVNEQSILSGSATRATVPDSYYTTARITNPRYNGCETISPTSSVYEGFVNRPMVSGSSIGAVANIEQYCDWFAYFDNVSDTVISYVDDITSTSKTANAYSIHITTLIDINGNTIDLSPTNNIPPSGSTIPNPLLSNIPLINSIYPYNFASSAATSSAGIGVELRQYSTSGSINPISGSFSSYNVWFTSIQPTYYSGLINNIYGTYNETIIILNPYYPTAKSSPSTNIPGLLIPQNFNPKYKNNLLRIAQDAGFFKNV